MRVKSVKVMVEEVVYLNSVAMSKCAVALRKVFSS